MVNDEDVRGGAPAVVSAFVIGDGRVFAGLLQHLLQRNENVAADIGVEVAGQENWGFLVFDDALDTFGDKFHRLAAGDLTHVIQMRIETV